MLFENNEWYVLAGYVGVWAIMIALNPALQPCLNATWIVGLNMFAFSSMLTMASIQLYFFVSSTSVAEIKGIKAGQRFAVLINVSGCMVRLYDAIAFNHSSACGASDMVGTMHAFYFTEYLLSFPFLAFVVAITCYGGKLRECAKFVSTVVLFALLLLISSMDSISSQFYIAWSLIALSIGCAGFVIVALFKGCNLETIHINNTSTSNSLQAQHQYNMSISILRNRYLSLSFLVGFCLVSVLSLAFISLSHIWSPQLIFSVAVVISTSLRLSISIILAFNGLELCNSSLFRLKAEEAANVNRRAFLRYVFHEVRVPLNSLCMGIEVLSTQTQSLPDDDIDTLWMMKDAAMQLDETLNDVLAIQKIEEGALQLEFKTFSFHDLISSSIQPHLDQADSKGVIIKSLIPSNVCPLVCGDKSRLKHVLTNLISNAVKYCSPDTVINITITDIGSFNTSTTLVLQQIVQQESLSVKGENTQAFSSRSAESITPSEFSEKIQDQEPIKMRMFEISVSDRGPGIDPQHLSHLFNPFLSTKPGELRKTRGTGIGLAICKQIVALHGGDIFCQSKVDIGSTFTIRIPLEVITAKSSKYTLKTALGSTMKEITRLGNLRSSLEAFINAQKSRPAGKHAGIFDKSRSPSPQVTVDYDPTTGLYTSLNSNGSRDHQHRIQTHYSPSITASGGHPKHSQNIKLPPLALPPRSESTPVVDEGTEEVISTSGRYLRTLSRSNTVPSREGDNCRFSTVNEDPITQSKVTLPDGREYRNMPLSARSNTSNLSVSSCEPFEQLLSGSSTEGEYLALTSRTMLVSSRSLSPDEDANDHYCISKSESIQDQVLLTNLIVSDEQDADAALVYSPLEKTPQERITSIDTRLSGLTQVLPPPSEVSPRGISPRGISPRGIAEQRGPAISVNSSSSASSVSDKANITTLTNGSRRDSLGTRRANETGIWHGKDWAGETDSPFVKIDALGSGHLEISIPSGDGTKRSVNARTNSAKLSASSSKPSLATFSVESSDSSGGQLSHSQAYYSRFSKSNSSGKASQISYSLSLKEGEEPLVSGTPSVGSRRKASMVNGHALPVDSSIREAAIQSLAVEAQLKDHSGVLQMLSTIPNASLFSLLQNFVPNSSVTTSVDDRDTTAVPLSGPTSPRRQSSYRRSPFRIAIPTVFQDPGITSDRSEWDAVDQAVDQIELMHSSSSRSRRISPSSIRSTELRSASPNLSSLGSSSASIPSPLHKSTSVSSKSDFETVPVQNVDDVDLLSISLPVLSRQTSTSSVASDSSGAAGTKLECRSGSIRRRSLRRTHSSLLNIATSPIVSKCFNILIVDDVLSNRKLLALLLRNKGLPCFMCEDGLEAVDFINSNAHGSINIIFMDNTMPRMTGIQCCQQLRKDGFQGIIVGLTGNSMDEELVEFSVAGADLVLTKPLRPQALCVILESLQRLGTQSRFAFGEKLVLNEDEMVWSSSV